MDLNVPGAGEEQPLTCLSVDADIRNCDISIVGNEDVVLVGQV